MTNQRRLRTAEIVAKIARGEVISAIKHTHLRNLHSLVLKERVDECAGMTRIYFADEGHGMESLYKDGEFSLMPHCHRQDISIELLFGSVKNVTFRKRDGVLLLYRYEFESPILGGSGRIETKCRELLGAPGYTDMADMRIDMPYYCAHSMTVGTPTAAWIVREGQVAPSGYNPPLWALRPDRVLDMTGMYEPASRDDIADMCRRIINAL